jgi:hypothetical protein
VRTHSILVTDDGELSDIRALLAGLDTDYIWVRGDALSGVEFPMPSQLLIATARQALRAPPRAPGEATPTRVAILTDDSSTLRARLVGSGFDYLVRRPVHPMALRLLVLRLLYRGEEKRAAERVPVGCSVAVRHVMRWRPALLADLSPRGCRLLVPRSAKPDTRLTLRLPREVTQDSELMLRGWVVRCERDAHASPELPYVAALAFDLLPAQVDRRLRAVLARAALGPLTIDKPEGPPEAIRPVFAGRSTPAVPRSRLRRSLRRPFSWRVVAIQQHDRAMRVLVGRDLSVGGMFVEPHPGLHCGDRVSLAFFGNLEQRLVVDAEVVREEREGLALRFLNAGPELAARLEAVMADDSMRKTDAPERDAVACVVTEIAGVRRSTTSRGSEQRARESGRR